MPHFNITAEQLCVVFAAASKKRRETLSERVEITLNSKQCQ